MWGRSPSWCCSMAQGLCVNSKVLHEEKVRLGNTGQIFRGASVGMVLGADLLPSRHSLKSVLNPSVCYPTHRGAVYGCQSSPSLHTRLRSPRVTTRGPAHTATVSVPSSCRTPALRKRAAQPGLEMGLASRQGPQLSPRCGTCTIPCFPSTGRVVQNQG